jgi:hypothetical protein
MKLFQICSPGSSPMLMDLDTSEGPVSEISVGQRGRRRNEGIIPITGEGPEVRAKKTDKGVVLVRGDWGTEDRCLIVINTVGSYDRFRSYGLFEAEGIQPIVSGVIAFGQAGRTNSGEEMLAVAAPNARFRLNGKYSSTWYAWDGREWQIESPEEREARLALQEAMQGGGEWL